jgi:hypothetical protein
LLPLRSWLAAFLGCGMAWAAEPVLPAYPGATLTRIGDDLAISGQYYRIAYFTTPDSPKKVALYFAEEWKKRGIPTVADGDFTSEGVVSAFYTRQGLQRSVVVRREGARTLVLVSIKDLWVPAPRTRSDAFVALDGVLFQQELVSREDPEHAQQRTRLVQGAPSSNRTVVDAALQKAGFQIVREVALGQPGARRFVLEHVRGSERVTTTLSSAGPELSAVQQILTVSGARPR